jgi:hypothetical protein
VQEFKCAVATADAVVRWQDGPNRQITVPDEPSEVHAAWAVPITTHNVAGTN